MPQRPIHPSDHRDPDDGEDPVDRTIAGGTVVGLPQVDGEEAAPGEARARFEPAELRTVLAHYRLGELSGITELEAGSRRAPKVRISGSEGEFLLKRRAARPELVERVVFNHGLQLHLEADGVPVARLVGTLRENRSMLILEEQVYELFEWVDGRRIVRAAPEVRNAGRILGRLHRSGERFEPAGESGVLGFHAARTVKHAFERVEPAIVRADPAVDRPALAAVIDRLHGALERARDEVEAGGWDSLPDQPIHGDWHPGNVLFTPGAGTERKPGIVRAVIDFDSSRREPRLVDLANGLLHFAMRSDRDRSPADWPISLSPSRMEAMVSGWREIVGPPLPGEGPMLPSLMIEALVAESVVPIARHGRFAAVPGHAFLEMVSRKAGWIAEHARAISSLLDA